MNKPARTIVIPAYAEAKFIEGTLKALRAYLKDLDWLETTEVIVVTADAEDGTPDIVGRALDAFPLRQQLRPGPRVGKGRDVLAGLRAARADRALFMDADMATPLKYIEQAFGLLEKSSVVIGTRDLGSMHKTVSRRLTSRLSNMLIRLLIGWGITDSQCGFKAFDRRALDIILPRAVVQGWGFDFELIKIARIHKLSIVSLPIPDWHDPKPEGTGLAGDSQLAAMRQTFKELLAVKRNQRRGLYR